MSKYTHKADLKKLRLITTLTAFMKEVQKQVQLGYNYYFENKFEYTKLVNVLGRLDEDYHVCESSDDRYHRQQENKVSIQLLMFYPGVDEVYFVLLARPGVNGSMNHNFFKTLKPRDATLGHQRFTLNQYVLIRVNTESYKINNGKDITVPAVQGKWSYGLQRHHIELIKTEFIKHLKANDTFHLNQLYQNLTKLIPFAKVRTNYVNLRIFMSNEINTRLKADKFFKVSMAGDFYNMPETLPILKGIKIPSITVAEQIKDNSLKKMTHPELKRKTIFYHDE